MLGSFMSVRFEVNINKPLLRRVAVFSLRRNSTDWFDVQYENLPHYCFSCGIVGHTSTECNNLGERDADVKLPYSADCLCAPDERKKRAQAAKSLSGMMSGDYSFSINTPSGEKPSQSARKGAAAGQASKHGEAMEVSSPVKRQHPRACANNSKAGKGHGKEKVTGQESGGLFAGHKRKQHYHAKEPPGEVEAVSP
jgi:hypothetical protein